MMHRAEQITIHPKRMCPKCGHDVTVQLAYGTFNCPECGEQVGWRSTVAEADSVERAAKQRLRKRLLIAVGVWVIVMTGLAMAIVM